MNKKGAALGVSATPEMDPRKLPIFPICELAHSIRIAVGQTMRLRGGFRPMTEPAKQRITGDVIILVLGLAILIVLIFVGLGGLYVFV
jgi:hypothetical protein